MASNRYAQKTSAHKTRLFNSLLDCILKGREFPEEILNVIVPRASDITRHDSPEDWMFYLRLTCAILSGKYEVENMLNINETDPGYLYGRLLGVLDCAEKHYLRDKSKKRRTNAEKALHNLRHKPLQTFAQVSQKVTALKIDARVRYIADWWTIDYPRP